MINVEYINGSINLETNHLFRDYESFMESCKIDINTMFADFDMMQEKVVLESAIMGTVPENDMMVYETEKKNIFTKIGEMVIAIYKKLAEFIDKAIDHIKTLSFKKKSDLQKLDILLKNHPELKNEAIAAFHEGALDLSDVKSLKELNDTFDEILKMSRKKDIDPKSLRGKWEKAKEKFEKSEKTWKTVGTVLTVASAAILFMPKIKQGIDSLKKMEREHREEEAAILKALKEEGHVTSDMGILQTKLQIIREMNGKRQAVCGNYLKSIDNLANWITKTVDKHNPDKNAGNRLQKDLEHIHDSHIAREKNNESIKAYGKLMGENEFYNNNRRDQLKKERDKAYNQAAGRNAAPTPNKKS